MKMINNYNNQILIHKDDQYIINSLHNTFVMIDKLKYY
jgi:hypothetical protein